MERKPDLTEETVSETRNPTPKENVDSDVEGKEITNKLDTIKSQGKYPYMQCVLETCDHHHDTMAVHIAQHMDKCSASEEKAPTVEVVKLAHASTPHPCIQVPTVRTSPLPDTHYNYGQIRHP